MRIERSIRDGYVVLSLADRVDLLGASRLHRELLEWLAERPPAIVCDLSGVEEVDPLCAGIFTAVRHPDLGWPGTTLVLCAPRPSVARTLAQLRVTQRLPVYASLDEALDRARERPRALQGQLTLGPGVGAAAAARAFVRRQCARWALDNLADLAVLLANELVTNAVVHARTALDLRLELRGARLHIAVRDRDPRPARLTTDDELAERSRGLVIVDRAARAWGVDDHPAGGKVVWCVLDVPAEPLAAT